jgi:hypothetical protein
MKLRFFVFMLLALAAMPVFAQQQGGLPAVTVTTITIRPRSLSCPPT